jgi:methylated-DNA-[protein]-cysteine S-methyltransferase
MNAQQPIQPVAPLADALAGALVDTLTNYSAVIPFTITGFDKANLSLAITITDRGLAGIDYVYDLPAQGPADKLGQEVVRQLECYFKDPQWHFDLPLDLTGTPFQQRLWRALKKVPPGTVDTYGQLARQLNSGAQAVGQACRRNPVPVVVPCHRIVSQQGMGGYAGEVDGEKMSIKRALLTHEGYSGV